MLVYYNRTQLGLPAEEECEEDWKKKGGDMVGTPWARAPPNPVGPC